MSKNLESTQQLDTSISYEARKSIFAKSLELFRRLKVTFKKPGEMDNAVANFVTDANETHISHDEVLSADTVGIEEVLEEPAPETAHALARIPTEDLELCLQITEQSISVEAAAEATRSIEIAELTDYFDSIELHTFIDLYDQKDEVLLQNITTVALLEYSQRTQLLHNKVIKLLRQVHFGVDNWNTTSDTGQPCTVGRVEYSKRKDFSIIWMKNLRYEYEQQCASVEDAGYLRQRRRSASIYGHQMYCALLDAMQRCGGPEYSQPLSKIARDFLNDTDLYLYGREVIEDQNDKWQILNDLYFDSIIDFTKKVSELGPEIIISLHERLGIVNFHRYSAEQLNNAYRLLRGDKQALKEVLDEGVDVYLVGVDGDHNGAFLEESLDSKTIPFEVRRVKDLWKVIEQLTSMGLGSIRHLTIAGHGDENGLYIAQDILLYDGAKTQRFNGLGYTIAHDSECMNALLTFLQQGENNPSITLASCSQGKEFDGAERSLADAIAENNPGVSISAATEIAYIDVEYKGEPLPKGYGYMLSAKKLTDWLMNILYKNTSMTNKDRTRVITRIESIAERLGVEMFEPTAETVEVSIGIGGLRFYARTQNPKGVVKIG
jgi:hypothetical protein